jgi:hypothetical protein
VGFDLAKVHAVVLSEVLLNPRGPGGPVPRSPGLVEVPLEGFDELFALDTSGEPSPAADG